jgi:hypothetical protein
MGTNGTGKFEMGTLSVSEKAEHALAFAEETLLVLLTRHIRGEWGEVTKKRKQANEKAARQGGPILSIYSTSKGDKIRVLTRADRSRTVIYTNQDLWGGATRSSVLSLEKKPSIPQLSP